ncbi:MAG: LysR family transcriptional regulator [Salinivirgaceae bacterium]|nr:LysR family transcriptional regulator [Salinivirgaceae bacterium]
MAGSKGSKYYNIFLDYQITLEHKEQGNLLDEYCFKLIKKIQETGSLKAAADELEVSYRKAWGNVEEIEKGLGFKLLERQRGGASGGKTSLTPDGEKLIAAHEELRTEFNTAIRMITKKFFNTLNTDE